MLLLELLPSHITPGALVNEFTISSGVLLSTCRVALTQSCRSSRSCPITSLFELLRSLVTPGSLAQSCLSWGSCPVMSLLELFPSHVTPGAHAQS